MPHPELIPRLTYSSPHYYQVRDVLPKQDFQPEGSDPAMSHTFDGGMSGLTGTLYLLPEVGYERGTSHRAAKRERLEELVRQKRSALSDLEADVLDILCAYWLKRSQGKDEHVWIDTDKILHARGLRHKVNGSGSNSEAIGRGYKPIQRASVNWALHRIASLELEIENLDGHEEEDTGTSPVLEVESPASDGPAPGKLSPDAWERKGGEGRSKEDLDDPDFSSRRQIRYRPGALFRQYSRDLRMYQSPEIYSYRPNQSWEKRLARYFSWQWRVNQQEASGSMFRSVRRLLGPVVLNVNARRLGLRLSDQDPGPGQKNFSSRIRSRFESALDRLSDADVAIEDWEYGPSWKRKWSRKSNWQQLWLDSQVRAVCSPAMAEAHDFQPEPLERGIGTELRRVRKQAGLTQGEMVEKLKKQEGLKITQSSLSRIERWEVDPSEGTREALRQLLNRLV